MRASTIRDGRPGIVKCFDVAKAPTSPAPSPAIRCTSSAVSSPSRGPSCLASSSPPTRARASSTWRPTMARTISSCARRTASIRCSRSTATGSIAHDWLWLGGQGSVINTKFNAPDGPICSDLREAGALLAASADFQHSYPHSWRSKAKVIYRCTPQWFIAMDRPLPPSIAESFAEQRWENEAGARASSRRRRRCASWRCRPSPTPASSPKRAATARLDGRGAARLGDQPAAGVGLPIALFVEKKTGELLVDL